MASFYTGTNDFLKLLTFAKIFALCFDSALFGTMLSQAERCLGQRSVTAERCPGQYPAKMNTVQCTVCIQDRTESKLSAVRDSAQPR